MKLSNDRRPFEVSNRTIKDLGSLPARLVVNQISNSIETYDNSVISEIAPSITSDDLKNFKKQQRYILIIGAGASYSITNKILLASQAAKKIRKNLKVDKSTKVGKLIDDELKKLTTVYKLNEDDFETQLFAFSKYFPEEVVEELRKIYNVRYEVGRFYEVVAHMFKHRFIDVIINYNFDELLDNAIDEEIKNEDFTVVYSDGHCPQDYRKDLLNEKNRGLKYPIYIKPHGTISHPSTMRFTRDDYYTISDDIDNLIKDLLKGEHNDEDHKYEINLLVAGFGMKSFELNQLIKETNSGCVINTHIFDHAPPDKYISELHNEFQLYDTVKHPFSCMEDYMSLEEYKAIDKPIYKGPLFYHSYYRTSDDNSIDKFITKMWKEIMNLYDAPYKPKDITRHILISTLFQNKSDLLNSYTSEVHYFEERTYVEIIILYLKSDGIINETIINKSRVRKYYRLYKKASGQYSLSQILVKLGFQVYKGYLTDTYVHSKFKKFGNANAIAKGMYTALSKNIKNVVILDRLKKRKNDIINDHFRKLKENNRLVVEYSEEVKYDLRFNNLENHSLIRTDLHWSYEYQKILKADDWDLALTVSEMGRFLLSDANAKFLEGKKVEVVLANYGINREKNIFSKIDKKLLLSGKLFEIPWWMHNQHMIVFLKKVDKFCPGCLENNLLPIVGFYHSGRLLDRNVSPIILKDIDNLHTLVNNFTNYWQRAGAVKKPQLKSTNIDSFEELNSVREKLLKRYRK
ncbi:SIR2 family protein [Neolewinella persica]|uniref:SIR2 family protein n=1 Tax=Neolewinella persica TaxID=70998 RepID=UPI00035F9FB4|nr:SIR2 family protein [Neolewinella persica]